MKHFLKDFSANPKFRNPVFWTSLIAILFASAGIEFNTLTSWALMGEAIMGILANPVAVVAVIVAMVGVFNDNSSKGIDGLKANDNKNEVE